jgi:hypothetical protein
LILVARAPIVSSSRQGIGGPGYLASVGFTPEGASLLDGIRSAIRDVRKAGFEVSRVEIETAALENA